MTEMHNAVRKVSVGEWCKLAKQGAVLPIVTKLYGNSMEPLILREKDLVRIVPVLDAETLTLGDIVLFERQDGAYVVHRIYQIDAENGFIQTWGDNCIYPDQAVPASAVYGLAVSRCRDGHWISLITDKQRRKGLRWLKHRSGRRIWMFYKRCIRKLKRLFRIESNK